MEICPKERCTGCGACAQICPAQAVSMKADPEGFARPFWEEARCLRCGLCARICPVNAHEVDDGKVFRAFVCKNSDGTVRRHSTSGGFFSAVAAHVLDRGGVVFGVKFGEGLRAEHCCVTVAERLADISRSKYVQSDVGDAYRQVERNLREGRWVLFSGTPCQIEALKAYLGREYDNLICCDVVCHGVASPLLWEKYLGYLAGRYGSVPISAAFREKVDGFHGSRLIVRFLNGRVHSPGQNADYMWRFFESGMALRPSCYDCAFKQARHSSDFTMFDCWDVSRLVPGRKDDDGGYTNVFVHSPRALELFRQLEGRIAADPTDAERAIACDGIMVLNSAEKPQGRDRIFEDIQVMRFQDLGKKYAPIPTKTLAREVIKELLRRVGLLSRLRALIRNW